MIRRAVVEDIPEMVTMGREFFTHSILPELGLKFDDACFASYLRSCIERGDETCVLVACEEIQPIGMFVGFLQGFMASDTQSFGTEQVWWVNEEKRRGPHAGALMRAFEQWARERGADAILMGGLDGDRRELMERFYRMKGFRPMEYRYFKEM